MFNDIAVAASAAMREHGLDRILVVDLDVHQGNGTSAIFADDPRVRHLKWRLLIASPRAFESQSGVG